MWRALLTLLTLASTMGASPWTFRAGSTTNAPALDAILATFAGASNNLGTATLDITPVAVYGTNRLLVVVVKANDNGSGNQPASVIWDPLGVNEALTLKTNVGDTYVYAKVAPTVGTNLVRLTYLGVVTDIAASASLFQNVKQADPFGTFSTRSASISAGALTITNAAYSGGLTVSTATVEVVGSQDVPTVDAPFTIYQEVDSGTGTSDTLSLATALYQGASTTVATWNVSVAAFVELTGFTVKGDSTP